MFHDQKRGHFISPLFRPGIVIAIDMSKILSNNWILNEFSLSRPLSLNCFTSSKLG